jgi:hypothetical protein
VARPPLSYGKNLELKRPEVKGLQKQPQSLEELSYGKNLELKRPEVKGLQKQPQSLEERGTTKKALAWSLHFEVREYEKDSPPHLSAPSKQLKEQPPTPEATEAANRTAYQRMVHTANRERARLRAANIAEICPHLPREASQA